MNENSDFIGGFTGVYPGLFAAGNKVKSTSDADVVWFNYQGK
ncbi:MAG: hypothetical protein H7096_03840 [Flavobacterium sp.]|nr:hypothetical protein [Pedobacter sp.]